MNRVFSCKKNMEDITNCSVCNVEQRFKTDEILVGRVFRCKKCEESVEITSVTMIQERYLYAPKKWSGDNKRLEKSWAYIIWFT